MLSHIFKIMSYIFNIMSQISIGLFVIFNILSCVFTPLGHMSFQILFQRKCSQTLLTLMRHEFFGNV